MRASETAAAIALMGVVTYLTRVGGMWLLGLMNKTTTLQRFLNHLSGSILAALTVSVALGGDWARFAGVIAAGVVMLSTRRALLALVAGTLFTAIVRL